MNKIPLIMKLSRKIYLTDVNHLMNGTVRVLFRSFKEVYQYNLHHGFCISRVHADGDFEPLNILIVSLSGGPLVNLSTENKYVPDIE